MSADNKNLAASTWSDGGVGMTGLTFTAMRRNRRCTAVVALAAAVALLGGCQKSEQAPSGPKTFASPDAAATAVYNAAKAQDGNALLAIFGPGATDLVSSGDPVQDKAARE